MASAGATVVRIGVDSSRRRSRGNGWRTGRRRDGGRLGGRATGGDTNGEGHDGEGGPGVTHAEREIPAARHGLCHADSLDQQDGRRCDVRKLIPEELVPVQRIGRLVLDRRVDNFFAETEKAACCTQNIVRGVDFTNDPLLQGRNFSYLDTQIKRLGRPNFTHIPVTAPKCPMAHFQQDGHAAMVNPVGRVNYEPNSWTGDPARTARGPRARLPVVRGERDGRQATHATGELRRSLQPSRPVLPQPILRRAETHHRRIHIRAQQGRASRHPRTDGRQLAQRRRGPRHNHRESTQHRDPATNHTRCCAAEQLTSCFDFAEHPRQRPGNLRGRQNRCHRHRRRANATAWNNLRRIFTKEGATVEVIAVAVLASADGATTLAGHPAAKDFITDAMRTAKSSDTSQQHTTCSTPPASAP